ncbi:MAG: 2-oxoglutarate dehydrogenase E1 component [Planctomycetia bacterium]|nr:2-oxoglutarate dehydrogenase E1 component [Planctomycetia bacterium]
MIRGASPAIEELASTLSIEFVEGLYADYLRDPLAVSEEWRGYFANWMNGDAPRRNGFGPSFRPPGLFSAGAAARKPAAAPDAQTMNDMQHRVDRLVREYRVRGHVMAKIDPLDIPRSYQPELEPYFHDFTDEDLDRTFVTGTIHGVSERTLREILELLRNTYCRSIGVQFMHIDDLAVRHWLLTRMEHSQNRIQLSREQQLAILSRLTDATIFEEFVQKKYIGAKSFSLEGAESLIPLLDLTIEKAGSQGVREVVMAMAHRGRLNVLANIMGKRPREIFREFEDSEPDFRNGRGDVKYHLGYSSQWRCANGKEVHLSLCFNPSHLEFVNPVALGRTRAKQDRNGDYQRNQTLTLLIHGDAAFAGEGVSQETLNLSQLPGYRTGGTLHVVVNNQIGFTTSPHEGRSCSYATDVARMLQIPIFHVNGEDPEAVAAVVNLALDFRAAFQRDVVIDMYCYRRRGHNEGDEPAFTQPVLYATIEKRKTVREGYLDHLLALGGLTREEADRLATGRQDQLEDELRIARGTDSLTRLLPMQGIWKNYLGGPDRLAPEVETGVSRERLMTLLQAQTKLPDDFHPHPKVLRILKGRQAMAVGSQPLDWSTAESLAFATLAVSGHRVRLSGQDVGRGTFSQRHAVLHDTRDGHRHIPLRHLEPGQAPVEIVNSPLSEVAVLGFDYGYSLDYPSGLVMWEAQFGDFVNVAQVIIDQFLTSAEDKWRRLSGLVLLLPHGFEGMGPEHSSARLERFLLLAAEDNIQIVNLSTPAQYFHCLRRQVLRRWAKPLVMMTPKSLLRHPNCISTLDELATGRFQRFVPDDRANRPKVRRVLMCAGKVYYDLAAERLQCGHEDVAIVRLEQLYPLSDETMAEALKPYAEGTPVVWVQEEPENMGAWRHLLVRFGDMILRRWPLRGVCRHTASSPATGSFTRHKLEQAGLIGEAFAP